MKQFKKGTYFIIATGGYLNEPVIEKMVITEEDIKKFDPEEVEELEYNSDEPLESNAVRYYLNDVVAEYAQKFASAIWLSEKEFESMSNMYHANEIPERN